MIRQALIALLLCVLSAAADVSKDSAMLARERDPGQLEQAAVRIASSGDPIFIAALGKYLAQPSFLGRLDPPSGTNVPVVRLAHVFDALRDHPSEASARICVDLANSRAFTAVPSRLNLVLGALAAVRPLPQAAADVFHALAGSGYAETEGPLLAKNGSQRALDILKQILGDPALDTTQRVSIAHHALVPVRTDARVLAMCVQVLAEAGLSSEVRNGVLESLFEYRPVEWFGREPSPVPPTWQSASVEARGQLRAIGKSALSRSDLPASRKAGISRTLSELGS